MVCRRNPLVNSECVESFVDGDRLILNPSFLLNNNYLHVLACKVVHVFGTALQAKSIATWAPLLLHRNFNVKQVKQNNMKTINHKVVMMAAVIISAIPFLGCEKEVYMKDEGNLVPKTVDEDPGLPSITSKRGKASLRSFRACRQCTYHCFARRTRIRLQEFTKMQGIRQPGIQGCFL